MLTDRQELTEV